jgi:hypothetical protein
MALLPGHPGEWRVWSLSTLDWSTRVEVSPAVFPWARALNGGKAARATFKLGDPKVAETATAENLEPWERMLVLDYQGLIVYAGFITDTEYDRDTQTRTVDHEDLWTVLKRRVAADRPSDPGVAGRPLIYSGVSQIQLVKNVLVEGTNDAVRYQLPIMAPEESTGNFSRRYDGYQLPMVDAAIRDILDTENGPDLDFFPRWYGEDQFQWLMRVGDVSDGQWEWDVTARESPASGLKERRSGQQMANRVIAVGEGSGEDMLTAVADGSATSSFMPLDAVTSYKDESDPGRLAARARADLAARSKPTKQVSMDVLMDDNDFAVHMLRLGGTVRWKTQGDPYFPDGWKSSRLIEFSGDLSKTIHLEFQEA